MTWSREFFNSISSLGWSWRHYKPKDCMRLSGSYSIPLLTNAYLNFSDHMIFCICKCNLQYKENLNVISFLLVISEFPMMCFDNTQHPHSSRIYLSVSYSPNLLSFFAFSPTKSSLDACLSLDVWPSTGVLWTSPGQHLKKMDSPSS